MSNPNDTPPREQAEFSASNSSANLKTQNAIKQLKLTCPLPWYLDQDNAAGVCVKDARGDQIFYEDFGSIPDEWKSHMRETVIVKARTMAHFLMAWSEENGGPFYGDGY